MLFLTKFSIQPTINGKWDEKKILAKGIHVIYTYFVYTQHYQAEF